MRPLVSATGGRTTLVARAAGGARAATPSTSSPTGRQATGA
jgi:hypothetical protein